MIFVSVYLQQAGPFPGLCATGSLGPVQQQYGLSERWRLLYELKGGWAWWMEAGQRD